MNNPVVNTKCHFCSEFFIKAKPEHVFPAAIGGGLTIKTVCNSCNETLGRLVDEPFSNHKAILRSRVMNQISRGARKIKNPLKGETHIDEEGKEYTLRMNEDGYAITTLKPILPDKSEIELGKQIKFEIDIKELHKADVIASKLLKRAGLPKVDTFKTEIVKVSQTSESTHIAWDESNKFILGNVKILFECAAELVQGYIESADAKNYAQMLLSGKINKKMGHLLQINEKIENEVISSLGNRLFDNNNEHLVIISGCHGLGLIGIIKTFDYPPIMIVLNSEDRFLETPIISIFNNYKKEKAEIYRLGRVKSSNVSIIDRKDIIYALIEQEFGSNCSNSKPLYDKNGIQVHSSVFKILGDHRFPRRLIGDYKSEFSTYHKIAGQLFMYSILHKKMLPLESLQLIHSIDRIK